MINMEKGWNSNTKKKANSRKSFGNVFAAAAAEDEKRAELEAKILQESMTSPAEGAEGWMGSLADSGNSLPKPSDASRKVLNALKAYVTTHKISIKDLRIELNRLFPHGELDSINDVRTAIKVIGRNQISSADVHSIVKYLDAVGQWRGDRKMRWADMIDFLTS